LQRVKRWYASACRSEVFGVAMLARVYKFSATSRVCGAGRLAVVRRSRAR
jgi:hypothetical protein